MDDVVDLTWRLCELCCVTGEEGPIADMVEAWFADRGVATTRHRTSIVAGDLDDPRPMVLLVGHTDVVPPTDADAQPRWDGDQLIARGSSDMKAGLAVAMHCAADSALRDGPYNIVCVAYAGEEGPQEGNELGPLLEALPRLATAQLAVVGEPTDGEVQLGCLGALHVEVTVRGRAAHAARPWQGTNAITSAGPWLTALGERQPEDVTVDGLVYREVVTATQAWTTSARNVVPDAFTVNLNYRFAPDKDVAAAEARVRAIVGDVGDVVVTDRALAAPPHRDAPLIRALCDALDAPITPKQAWTDVAQLAAAGVPAVNYGPGIAAQAHQRGEWVPRDAIDAARTALGAFLGG